MSAGQMGHFLPSYPARTGEKVNHLPQLPLDGGET